VEPNGRCDPGRRKAARLLRICAAALLLAACGPQPEDCAKRNVWCAGLVTDFGSVAEGINSEAWQALQDAKSSGVLDRVDRIETVDSRDRGANIAALADDGYDIIVTVGASIGDETAAAAKRHPDLRFIGVEQPQQTEIPNLVGLEFHEERSGFLAGAVAGLISQTGNIAAVCEANYIDAIRRYCDGFQAGALYSDPAVIVSVSYRDGSTELLFHDPDWGRAAALAQLADGADVVFAAGGETADAVLLEAAANGALVIGSETDLYDRLPELRPSLLTSAFNDIRSGVRDLLRAARHGTLPAGEYFGQVGLAPFHDLEGRVPGAAIGRLAEIRALLDSGEIGPDVPYRLP
jgi:basic membrane protein A